MFDHIEPWYYKFLIDKKGKGVTGLMLEIRENSGLLEVAFLYRKIHSRSKQVGFLIYVEKISQLTGKKAGHAEENLSWQRLKGL